MNKINTKLIICHETIKISWATGSKYFYHNDLILFDPTLITIQTKIANVHTVPCCFIPSLCFLAFKSLSFANCCAFAEWIRNLDKTIYQSYFLLPFSFHLWFHALAWLDHYISLFMYANFSFEQICKDVFISEA